MAHMEVMVVVDMEQDMAQFMDMAGVMVMMDINVTDMETDTAEGHMEVW